MVRQYKRKRPRQWRDKDKRMAAAVRMRDAGLSLRQIGAQLAVDERTVRRDLARWDDVSASNVVPLVRQKTAATRPAWGNLPQQNAAPIASEVLPDDDSRTLRDVVSDPEEHGYAAGAQ